MTRVLVVDDEKSIRITLGLFLEDAGYDVDTAENGYEAMELHRQRAADVVVTDILMPRCDGLEHIRALRKHSPEVKVIAISAGGDIGSDLYLQLAVKFGAERVLSKPISRFKLLETLEDLLGAAGDSA